MTINEVSHLSFTVSRSELRDRILIPKYYDPEIAVAAKLAEDKFALPRLGDLLRPSAEGSRLGTWIRREHYGTGPIPYVRTSDLNGWKIRSDYKKGVSFAVHASVANRQDMRAGDILFVAHGTYLVGTVAIVTEDDLPLVLQDHVFRLRPDPQVELPEIGGIDGWLILAALSTQFVRRQVRIRQFSANIIDKVGERHLELRLPIPRDETRRRFISEQVRKVIYGQTDVRLKVSSLLGSDMKMTRERAVTRHGFSVSRAQLTRRVLIPKYYDPELRADLDIEEEKTGTPWTSLGELIDAGSISADTGIEVGKMAYGTGNIPFLRTTDIADLEIRADPRQGISQAIYDEYAARGAVANGDVLVVRDGTYLVGSSALVGNNDLPALICGGLYRLRTKKVNAVSSSTLLALMNLPLTRRQMRSKQFTRDVIDTLGYRLLEVRIPHPTSTYAYTIGNKMSELMSIKSDFRQMKSEAIEELEPTPPAITGGRPGWSMRG